MYIYIYIYIYDISSLRVNVLVKTMVCKGRQANVVGIVTRLQAGGSGV